MREALGEIMVEYFDFEVLRGEQVISSETSVPLHNTRAAWPKIVKIARGLEQTGCRIRVREQSGDTVILIGAAAARKFSEPEFQA